MDVAGLVAWIVAVTIAITIHEFAHAKRAEVAGDSTPRRMGRITLNPLAHYDPMGTTLFLFAGFGWAKPVPVNAALFRNGRRDMLMVSLWGPLSNFLAAVLFAIPVRLGLAGDYSMAQAIIVLANLFLGVFNLIPVRPLDGSHILEAILQPAARQRLEIFYAKYGQWFMIALLMILFLPPLRFIFHLIVLRPVLTVWQLLIGIPGGVL